MRCLGGALDAKRTSVADCAYDFKACIGESNLNFPGSARL